MIARRFALAAAAMLALSACGATPPPITTAPRAAAASAAPSADPLAGLRLTPDAPFRTHPPEPTGPLVFKPPAITRVTLANGLPVLLAPTGTTGLAHVDVVFAGGPSALPGERTAVWALPADLFEGSRNQTRTQIEDRLSAMFAKYTALTSADWMHISVTVAPNHVGDALALLAEVVTQPAFDTKILDRAHKQSAIRLAQTRKDASSIARGVLLVALYGPTHPYALVNRLSPDDVRSLTRDDMLHAHDHAINAATTSLVLTGNLRGQSDADLRASLDATFGAWKPPAGSVNAIPAPAPIEAGSPRIVVVDRPTSVDVRLAFGTLGPPMTDRDFEATLTLNTIFAGTTSSRLAQRLHDDLGFASRGYSLMPWYRGAAPWTWEANVPREHAADTLRAIDAIARALHDGGVTQDELTEATTRRVSLLPEVFDTPSSTASSLVALTVFGQPIDFWETRQSRIEAVTLDDVARAAKAHLDPASMKLVVVGDYESLRPSLKSLGWGPIEIRDPSGIILRVDSD
jgi:predicted Zn-dependent peptidase